MDYRLIGVVCTSHTSNLCVSTAICGPGVGPQPDRSDPLCANMARFFKFLVPTYAEEFALNLRRHVTQTLSFHVGNVEREVTVQMERLQTLYSDVVLPDTVVRIMNGGVGLWSHFSTVELSEDEQNGMRDSLFDILSDRLVRSEEKPIVSRFFLFSNCVHTMLLCKLLNIPVSVFSVSSVSPSKPNQKRIQRFASWYTNVETLPSLKFASLCLQLTQHATNMTAKKVANVGEVTSTQTVTKVI